MNTAGIREGDIVRLDVRGQRFFGLVAAELYVDPATKRRVIGLEPLRPGESMVTRTVTSRQIIDHWRKRRQRGNDNAKQHDDGL